MAELCNRENAVGLNNLKKIFEIGDDDSAE